jgi:predicted solute-binding protein
MEDVMLRELLLDDAPAIAPLALALELGWATLPVPVRTVPNLSAATARDNPGALVCAPLVEYADLQEAYRILPELAAGGHHGVATVLLADRRLDEVDDPIVDLAEISRTAECLARATLLKFYGITAAAWVRDGQEPARLRIADCGLRIDASPVEETAPGSSPESAIRNPQSAIVEVREGGEALHLLDEPGDRVVSDLGRAWFILTGLPPVSHLLLAPNALLAADDTGVQELVAALPVALAVVHERRRELRRTLAERYGVSRDLLNAFYNDQFLTLTGDAQKSILALFPEGAWGMDLPTVARLNLAPWAVRV